MSLIIGIRAEDKNRWEKRTPLTPDDAAELYKNNNVEIIIQNSSQRIFTADEYSKVGIQVSTDVNNADIILGVKEIPAEKIIRNKSS